jgi:spore coat polysaccharide biosynthesis protein SpsF
MNLAILQARMSSTRLPGKVLMPIVGKPMIQLHLERLARCKNIDHLVVATSDHTEDNAVAELCQNLGVQCYQGSLDNVLDRFYQAASLHPADNIVRLTADCPMADPQLIDKVIEQHITEQNDFTTNASPHTFPDGVDVEVMRFSAMRQAWQNADTAYQQEHVTPYITDRPEQFKIASHISPVNYNQQRWTVDYPEDFALVKFVYESLYAADNQFDSAAILQLLQDNPEVFALNQQYVN